ncbi:hypothetical protein [Phytoactinopolyspora halophila]|nr:hypothetical protein [Phytoactinopolyspora halophila]
MTVRCIRRKPGSPQRPAVHGYTRSDIMHVAQSRYHDIVAVEKLGYRTCWIERRREKVGYGATPEPAEVATPDLHFSTLAEVAHVVRADVEGQQAGR